MASSSAVRRCSCRQLPTVDGHSSPATAGGCGELNRTVEWCSRLAALQSRVILEWNDKMRPTASRGPNVGV